MLRWFPRLQVATACFSCSPPDLNFLDPYFIFMYMQKNHCHRATAHLQLNILLLLLLITCKQGIYNYVPATSHVPAAPLLHLQFMVHIMLFPMLKAPYLYISTSRSMCAVSIMAIFRCSSMPFTFFLNVFEMVPVAPLITGIGIVFTFHMRCISIA